MNRIVIQIVSVMAIALFLVPQGAQAAGLTEFSRDVEFRAQGTNDEVQNHLDSNEESNVDTWDPVPQGVWFGGWRKESLLRLTDVPDEDYEMALATVCRFGSDMVMSGAARTLVRLPVRTSDDPWTRARLNVYKIDQGTNWSFIKTTTESIDANPHNLNDLRVNFTTGPHELIFWSQNYYPTDESPTDGNDHFSRANRTYVFVDAPLEPDRYYLFITYVWYGADKYVEVFVEPDSLTGVGGWNRSSVGRYNRLAPDSYVLYSTDYNVSLGYSFDFRHGFGNSAYGFNVYMNDGDELEFFSYVDPDDIDVLNYLSFMLPYRSSLDNISWNVSIKAVNVDDGGFAEVFAMGDVIARDFILFSMFDDWNTNVSALPFTFRGWFRVSCQINNDTRLWLPLWNTPRTAYPNANASWFTGANGTMFDDIWDSGPYFNYNLMRWIEVQRVGGEFYGYHWQAQHSIQFNNYRWEKTAPEGGGTEALDPTENMTLTQKYFYGLGDILISVGSWIANIPYGPAQGFGRWLHATGVAWQLTAQYVDIPDWLGWAYNKLRTIFDPIGAWLWKIGDKIVGFLKFLLDMGEIILALTIFIMAMVVLFTPPYFTIKGGMAIRKAILGDMEGAALELSQAASTAKAMGEKVKKYRPKLRRRG